MSTDQKEQKRVSRREFVKGAVVGAAGAVAAGVLTSCAETVEVPVEVIKEVEVEVIKEVEVVEEVEVIKEVEVEVIKEVEVKPWLPDKWDYEADVVVVGYGGAGAVAAITAHDAGVEVLVLEKAPSDAHYPNTKMSGGGGHYAKDYDDAVAYFKAEAFGMGLPSGSHDPPQAYPHYPEELVEGIADAWGKGVLDTADWVKQLNPSFDFSENIPSKDFPNFPGGEQYGSFGSPRTFGVVTPSGGQTLFKQLSDAVEERQINVLWETPGRQLITNGQGEVIGVVAERSGAEIAVKARKAVILTSGGFEYDEELKDAFVPGWKWAFMGNPLNTGDGVRMAMGVGAALGHMYHNAARVVGGAMLDEVGTGFRVRCNEPALILVDSYGSRYSNEDHTATSPQRYQFYNLVIHYDPSKLEYPRIPSWVVFDEKRRSGGPIISTSYGAHATGLYEWSEDNSAEVEKGWILKADSLDELAEKIGAEPDCQAKMDAATLKETIERWNQLCADGVDEDFGRERNLVPIDTPPYYATVMYPGGPNTEGGPIRNGKAQVISVFGKPIPRLYEAGELGSVFSFAYQCGGNIAECIIFGRIAGENAAAEEPWD